MAGVLTHLDRLEAESIDILREAVAESERPVLLYSIGKDSSTLLHLARKAFHPSPVPFPLLHVDTTWKFREMIEFRDRTVAELGLELLVHRNPECLALGVNPFDHGSATHTDLWKTQGLRQALDKHRFDLAFGGARRDEEASRAKERVFSFRYRRPPLGPARPTPGAVAALQRAHGARREHPGVPAVQLDRAGRVALPRSARGFPWCRCTSRRRDRSCERDGALIMVDDDRLPLAPGERPER